MVGAGFAGLTLAQHLRRSPVDITVVDRRNHHLFQPLLYQVATASLSPADIAAPIRKVLSKQRNARVILADVCGIDTGSRMLTLRDGTLAYDCLCLCTGVSHSYFGHSEWERLAPGLKTIEDAVEIRRRFLVAFEAAERETDAARRAARLTFVIVGGGPTGVELAGAMAEIARRSIPSDFRRVDTKTARIVLIEGEKRLLSAYPPDLSDRAKRDLTELGVEVMLGQRVSGIDEQSVSAGVVRIDTQNVMWAAGVAAEPLAKQLGCALDKAGRVLVGPDLTVPGHPDVFVLGDLASIVDPETGKPVPGICPAAMQMGRYAAGVVDARARAGAAGRTSTAPRPFKYFDKGILATIGRARAVADIRGFHIAGLVAWLLWALVHIFFLISFRNRMLVMIQWAWEWAFFQRGARLITGDVDLGLEGEDRAAALKRATAAGSEDVPVRMMQSRGQENASDRLVRD